MGSQGPTRASYAGTHHPPRPAAPPQTPERPSEDACSTLPASTAALHTGWLEIAGSKAAPPQLTRSEPPAHMAPAIQYRAPAWFVGGSHAPPADMVGAAISQLRGFTGIAWVDGRKDCDGA